jgi:DNA-binding response OmpR family regulator
MTSRRAFYKDKTVLVVDDSDQIRSYVKSMLLLIGFDDAVLARDADMALSYCRRMSFDFILCDFHLGQGRNGYQLLELLRTEKLLKPDCCFLVVSAERQRQAVHGMIEFQPADYLLKPFSYAELERRISRAYHTRHTLQLAYQAISIGDYDDAVLACDHVIEYKSQYVMHASRLKAELLLKQERFDEAEHIYQWALTVREFGWAKLGLAVTFGYQGRAAEAEALLLELSQHAETKVEAMDWLTRLYISQNKAKDALDVVEQVARYSPKNYLRQHVMANLAVVDNQKQLAANVHQKLLSSARYSMHDTADNMLNYARALLEVAQEQTAKERQETFAKIDNFISTIKKRFHPASFEHDRMVVEARILFMQGKMQKGLQLLESSEQLSLEKTLSVSGMLDRARAYFESDNLAMCEHYMSAIATVAHDDDLYCSALNMMMQYEKQKHQQLRNQATAMGSLHYSKAVEYFRYALEKTPGNVNIALNLLQAISAREELNTDLRALAQHCIEVIEGGWLPPEQHKRYQVILSHIEF